MSLMSTTVRKKREYFPRGLVQPEGGYRFSIDSLLLACFCRVSRKQSGIDLGTGCGVVALGLLLRQPELMLQGVDIEPSALGAAAENAESMGFAEEFHLEQGSVDSWRPAKVVDFVVSNPPYRELGRGRISSGDERKAARFEDQAEFADFARCAANALKTRGRFSFVHLPERLPELMDGLRCAGLVPKRMRLVHSRLEQTPKIVLMEAVKSGGSGLIVEPPLVLYQGQGEETHMTDAALEFCPYLQCNAGK